jgi:hypothetical protein
MTVYETIKQTIWEYQKDHIEFLRSHRKNLKSKTTRIGINISLIINSACYIEGYLENELKKLFYHRQGILRKNSPDQIHLRRIYNSFINKMGKDFEVRIARTSGLENFDSLIAILSYQNKPLRLKDYEYFEGMKVLFQLRNVLAHGREVSAQRVLAYWTGGGWNELFLGGYKQAENYLNKTKLINKKFTEYHRIDQIFTNKIADHFYRISKKFIKHCNIIFKNEVDESAVEKFIMKTWTKITRPDT